MKPATPSGVRIGRPESEASGKSTVTAKGVSPGGEAALPRPQGDFLEKKEIGRKTPPQ